jgi:DNA repair exonuclease SbcCD ATPase subunit
MDITYILGIAVCVVISVVTTYLLIRHRSAKLKERDKSIDFVELLKKKENIISEQTAKLEDYKRRLKELECKTEIQQDSSQTEKGSNAFSGLEADYLLEITNLKDKIKAIEEELEEAKEEIDDLERKNKRQQEKQRELEAQNEKLEKDVEEQIQLNEIFEEELTEKKREVEKRGKSLSFINDILSADLSGDKVVDGIETTTAQIEDFVCHDLLSTLKDFESLNEKAKKEIEANIKEWGAKQRKTWIKRKTVVAFIGEFSAGKTSIVNRILSKDNPNPPKLLVSSKATTAIPTYISKNDSPDSESLYKFFTPDGKLKLTKKAVLEGIDKDVLSQVNASPLIKYFVISCNNNSLRNLSILDTPGFNSNDEKDAERTMEVINESGALFWVFDANMGEINKTSIEIIRKCLLKPLYVVINKTDTKSPKEIDDLENHVKETMKSNGIKVEAYIRFSQNENIEILMRHFADIRQDEMNTEYANSLLDRLKNHERTLQTTINDTNKHYNRLKKDIEKKNDEIEDCINELTNECQDIEKLPEYQSKWFKEDRYLLSLSQYGSLSNGINHIQSIGSAIQQFNDEMQDFQKKLGQMNLTKEKNKEKLDRITSCITKYKQLLTTDSSQL